MYTRMENKSAKSQIRQDTCDNEMMHPIGWQWEQWQSSRAPVWGPAPNWAWLRSASGPLCVRCAGACLIGCRQPETGSGVQVGLLWLVEPGPKSLLVWKTCFHWLPLPGSAGEWVSKRVALWQLVQLGLCEEIFEGILLTCGRSKTYFLYYSPSSVAWGVETSKINRKHDNVLWFHINQPTKKNLTIRFMSLAKDTGVGEPQFHCAAE